MNHQKENIAKINAPRMSGILLRERLFKLIDSRRKRPILWISAPGGYGKTALVNSYIHTRKLSSIWYQCDREDSDPATFFYYMGLAGKKAAPRKKPLPLFTPEYLAGIPTFTSRYFEELYSRLRSPSCIVLDNYQDISEESHLHSIMSIALTQVPEWVTVIIVSRCDPPSAFVRLRANEHFHYIGCEELRFTRKETKEFITFRKLHKRSPDLETFLINKTHGWAAGMVLLSKQAALPVSMCDQMKNISFDDIFDYFSSEVFNILTLQEQNLLSKTACLPTIISDIARALTEINEAEDILSSLVKRNFFITKHMHAGLAVYQIHPLFREFLGKKGESIFSSEEIVLIKKRAATLLAKAGFAEHAAELFISSKEWDGLIPLIFQQAQSLLSQGRNQSFETWITVIPDHILNNTPLLLFWLGQSRMPLNPYQGLRYFEQAFNLFQSQDNRLGSFMAVSGVVNSILMIFDNFRQVEIWMNRLEKMIKEEEKLPEGEIGELITASMFLCLVFTKPWHPEFGTWEERAKQVLQTSSNLPIRFQVMFGFTNHYGFCGKFAETKLIVDLCNRILDSTPHSPLFDLQLKMAEAPYYKSKGEIDKSIKAAEKGLEISKITGIHILDFMFLGQAAWGYMDKADPSSAERYLKQMEQSLERHPKLNVSFYHYLMAIKYRLQGDLAMSEVHSGLSLKFFEEGYFYIPVFVSGLHNALISLERNKPKEAETYLRDAKKIVSSYQNPFALFSWHLMKAHIMFCQKKEKEGTSALKQAMAIGAAHNFETYLPLYSDVIADLALRAFEKGIEEKYVRFLIKKLGIILKEPPVHIESWPWPLKIYTLGRFALVKDGVEFQTSGKAQKKPLEMLKTIISYGGRKVPASKISDVLWPEVDGDTAQTSLYTTLFRLRKLLGQDEIIIIEDGTITLNNKLCWVDLWSFERLLFQADELKQKGDTESALPLMHKALNRYQGSFLGHDDGLKWSKPCCEKMRTKFLKNIAIVANEYLSRKKWEEAASCYLKALEEDDLQEEFYEGLMLSYKKLNNRSGIIKTYNRFKKNLSGKPDSKSGKKIRSLYQSVIKG